MPRSRFLLLAFSAGSLIAAVHTAVSPAQRSDRILDGEVRCFGSYREDDKGAVSILTLSSDGKTLAMGRKNGSVQVWGVESGKLLHLLEKGANSTVLALHLDNRQKLLYLWGPSTGMRILDLTTGRIQIRWKSSGMIEQAIAGAFSADGRKLLSWSQGDGTNGGKIMLCSASDGKDLKTLSSDSAGLPSPPLVAFSPDGRFVAETNGFADRGIRCWQTTPARERARFRLLKGERLRKDYFSCLAFSADGRFLVSGTVNGMIYWWDTEKGRLLSQWTAADTKIDSLAISADGKMLACGSSNQVFLLEVASGKKRGRFIGPGRDVVSLCFGRGSQILVFGSSDWPVLGWGVWGDVRKLTVFPFDQFWEELASEDATRAFKAATSWRHAGGHGIRLLQARLEAKSRPVIPANALLTAHLIANLDNNKIKIRNDASRQLAEMGETVVEALERARSKSLSMEARLRIDTLLAPREKRLLFDVRAWGRIVEMLEQTDSSEAKQLLRNADEITSVPTQEITNQERGKIR